MQRLSERNSELIPQSKTGHQRSKQASKLWRWHVAIEKAAGIDALRLPGSKIDYL
jgi:hypothetical protein